MLIDELCCYMGCTRSSIHVLVGERGMAIGNLRYKDNGRRVDCTMVDFGGTCIQTMISKVSDISSKAKMILVIEKHTIFMKLAQQKFYEDTTSIMIIGRGQLDMTSRLFLQKLSYILGLHVFGLMDCDYAGLQVFSSSKHGSKSLIFDNERLVTPNMKLLGVLPNDLDNLPPLKEHGIEVIRQLELHSIRNFQREEFVKRDTDLVKELRHMQKSKQNVKIEALN